MPPGLGSTFGSSSGSVGAGPPAKGSFSRSRLTTDADAMADARVQTRMARLRDQFPVLEASQASALWVLASGPLDDEQVMQAATDALKASGINEQVQWLSSLDNAEQISRAQTMDPHLRTALSEAGWQTPDEVDRGGGFLSGGPLGIGGMIGTGLRGGMGLASKATSLPGVKQVFGVMDWMSEEVSRTQRIAPMMDSGRRALDKTGETEEELLARTGIDANAAGGGNLGGMVMPSPYGMGTTTNPLHFLANPKDLWKAAQVWGEIGHDGKDDFLPEVQLEAFDALEAANPGMGKDLLRWAKGLAAGETPLDLAEADGLSGEAAQAYADKIGSLSVDEVFQAQQARLISAQISPGRTYVRAIVGEPTMDTSTGVARLMSGTFDAGFQVVADPTIVMGKVAKGRKLVKWALRSGEHPNQLHRWNGMSHIVDKIDELEEAKGAPLTPAEKAPLFAGMPGRSFKAVDLTNPRVIRKLEAEARAVNEPVRAVREAFVTGDFKKLTDAYPMLGASGGDLRAYDRALKAGFAAGLHDIEGMHTAAGVWDFFNYVLDRSSTHKLADPAFDLKINSTKLFGHDGLGHLVIPHMTKTQRARLVLKTGYGKWLHGVPEEDADLAVDELTEIPPDVAEALAVAGDEAIFAAENPEMAAVVDEQLEANIAVSAAAVDEQLQANIRLWEEQGYGEEDIERFKKRYGFVDEALEADHRNKVAQERSLLYERSLSEDPQIAEDAEARLDELEANELTRETLPKLDERQVHPQTGSYVKRIAPDLKQRLSTLSRWATTQTTKKAYVLLTDTPEGLESAKNFIDSVMLITKQSKVMADRYYNLWSNGTTAERRTMVNKLTYDMANITGMGDSPEAMKMFRDFIERQNKIYGFTDTMRTNLPVPDSKEGRKFLTHHAVMEAQLADAIAIPSMKQMMIATRKLNMLRWAAGTTRASWVESLMNNVWKPAVLFRLGFPLRAGADEMLQFTGRVGLLPYVREAVLKPWAGVRELDGSIARDRFGKEIKAPQAAFMPVRRFFDAWATIFGVTEEALAKRAEELAMSDLKWTTGNDIDRDFLLSRAREDVKRTVHLPGKTLFMFNAAVHETTLFASREFAKLAVDRKWMSRSEWAKWLLEREPQFAERMQSMRHMVRHAYAERGMAEAMGGAYSQDALDDAELVETTTQAMWDPNVAGKLRSVQLKQSPAEWTWYGDEQMSYKLNAIHHRLQSMMHSPSTRAAAEAMSHYVPLPVLDEVNQNLRHVVAPTSEDAEVLALAMEEFGELDGVNLFKAIHEQFHSGGWDNQSHHDAVNVLTSEFLTKGETRTLGQVADILKRDHGYKDDLDDKGNLSRTVFQQLREDKQLVATVDAWQKMGNKARTIMSDPKFGYIETSLEKAANRAVNNAYNALRRTDSASNLRRMVATSNVGGKLPMEPLQDGMSRVMVPMIDRRAAQELHTLLSAQGEEAEKFRGILLKHMRRNGVGAEFKNTWDAMIPEQGWDLNRHLIITKSNAITGDANYIPAGLVGSTNPEIAFSVRDAVEDYLPQYTVKPTVGFLDHPSDALREEYGFLAHGDAVLNVAPDMTKGVRVMDRDDMQKMLQVELKATGERTVLTEAELAAEGSLQNQTMRVRARRTKSRPLKNNKMLQPVMKGTKYEVIVDYESISADFTKGNKAFFKGTGGTTWRRGKTYEYKDADTTDLADRVAALLDELDLADNTGKDMEMLVGEWKGRNLSSDPITFEDVMKDHASITEPRNPKKSLWDDFKHVAARSKSTGTRPTVELDFDEWAAAQSKIAYKTLTERLGVTDADIDALTEDQYRDLLIERERAHMMLQAPGKTRAVTPTPEGMEQEADALANAWTKVKGLEPTPEMQARIQLGGESGGQYTILGEFYAAGATEDAAVRKMAINATEEVKAMFVGRRSGEVNHEILIPALRDLHRQENLWLRTDMAELMDRAPGKVVLSADETKLHKVLDRFFRGVTEPTIGAISRHPMYADAFHKGMQAMRQVYDNLADGDLAEEARQVLQNSSIDEKTLRDVNEFIMTNVRENPRWGEEGDYWADYAKALIHETRRDPAAGTDKARIALARIEIEQDWVAGGRKGGGYPSDWDSLSWSAQQEFLLDYAINDMGLADEAMDTLRRWHLNQSHAIDTWVDAASNRAVEMVIPYVDDHRVRSALQEYLGPVFLPFWYAEEQFLKRFSRGIYETPHMLRKGQLTMNGMRNLGFIQEDKQTGREYLIIPGSELFTGMAADMATALTGNEAYQVAANPLSMRIDMILPGWNLEQSRIGFGPLVALATDQATTRLPEVQWNKHDPDRRFWEYLVPGGISGAYRMASSDPNELITGELAALSYMYVNHPLDDNASPEEVEDLLEDARGGARLVQMLRFASGQLFGAAAPVDPGAKPRNEFNALLKTGLSHEDAFEIFMDRQKNPAAAIYAVYGTENEVGAPIPTTEGANEFYLANEELIKNSPSAMAWLAPQPKTRDEFDRRAYNEALSIGLRSKRSPKELVAAARIKQAAPDYWDMVDEYKAQRRNLQDQIEAKIGNVPQLQEELKGLDETYKTRKNSYLLMHPQLASSFGPENSMQRDATINQLRYLTDAGIGGEQGRKMGELIDKYHAFEQSYASYSGQSSKAAKRLKQELLDSAYDDMQTYVLLNPELKAFFTGVIRPQMPDVDEAKDKLANA